MEKSNKIKKLYFASSNKAKLKRLQTILAEVDKNIKIELVPDYIDVEEKGKDVLENAVMKVLPYKSKYKIPVLGMDTAVFFEGEDFDPTHIKRVALKGMDESKLSQKEIAEKIKDFYVKLAKKYGGEKEFYFEDGWAILFPDGSIEKISYKREYIMTDKIRGQLDIFFPMRSLYIVKATKKSPTEQTLEEELLELKPQIEAFKKLLKFIYN